MLCAGEGGCFLCGLLETPVATTGASLPVFAVRPVVVSPGGKEGDAEHDVESITADDVLGLGGTSTVFGATVHGMRCAVKLPLCGRPAEAALAIERTALTRLAARGVSGVPRIVCEVTDDSALISGPVGQPIAVSDFDVLASLSAHRSGRLNSLLPTLVNASFCRRILLVLRDVHAAGVIQGDLRLSNLVSDPNRSAAGAGGAAAEASDPIASPALSIIDFGSAFIAKKSKAKKQYRFKRVCPELWISLPYAHPDVLRAYALGKSYRPAPHHDLFMFAASLHRLLVPWVPCREVNSIADAEALATYWEILMAPVMPLPDSGPWPSASGTATSCISSMIDAPAPEISYAEASVSDASASGVKRKRVDNASTVTVASPPDCPGTLLEGAASAVASDSAGTATVSQTIVSPWGRLFIAAAKYDLPAFEVAAGSALRSVVPDWPW